MLEILLRFYIFPGKSSLVHSPSIFKLSWMMAVTFSKK